VELAAVVPSLQAKVAELERKIALAQPRLLPIPRNLLHQMHGCQTESGDPEENRRKRKRADSLEQREERDLIPVDEVDLVEEILSCSVRAMS